MTSTITDQIEDPKVVINTVQPTPKVNEKVLWIKPENDSYGLYIVTGE